MLYITGDTHGNADRFKQFKKLFPKYNDTVLVCGDFGFVWDGSEREKKQLSKLERCACNILFVEGTHDNLDLLEQFPEEELFGARVKRLAKNVFWLSRGRIYNIDGVSVFAIGGGESSDADERVEGVNWWRRELPDFDEIESAKRVLAEADNSVDVIISHQPPRLELGLINAQKESINALTAFLGSAARTVNYKHWYFGMDHIDRIISPRMTAVFEKIVEYRD